jgi:hypothetical protein
MDPIRPCATKLCTNPGPLEIPVNDPEFYRSVEDAKADARCGPCVFAIHTRCEGLEGDALHEKRFAVLQLPVFSLRPQQAAVGGVGLLDKPSADELAEVAELLYSNPWDPR